MYHNFAYNDLLRLFRQYLHEAPLATQMSSQLFTSQAGDDDVHLAAHYNHKILVAASDNNYTWWYD